MHRCSRILPTLRAHLGSILGQSLVYDNVGWVRLVVVEHDELAVGSPGLLPVAQDGVILASNGAPAHEVVHIWVNLVRVQGAPACHAAQQHRVEPRVYSRGVVAGVLVALAAALGEVDPGAVERAGVGARQPDHEVALADALARRGLRAVEQEELVHACLQRPQQLGALREGEQRLGRLAADRLRVAYLGRYVVPSTHVVRPEGGVAVLLHLDHLEAPPVPRLRRLPGQVQQLLHQALLPPGDAAEDGLPRRGLPPPPGRQGHRLSAPAARAAAVRDLVRGPAVRADELYDARALGLHADDLAARPSAPHADDARRGRRRRCRRGSAHGHRRWGRSRLAPRRLRDPDPRPPLVQLEAEPAGASRAAADDGADRHRRPPTVALRLELKVPGPLPVGGVALAEPSARLHLRQTAASTTLGAHELEPTRA
mmetsp:Transcript_23745/g.75254  ORF Transcript_23745/g.75254 Transcript_23745/m.75254 type:complete len:427 (-) Transcript_23745:7-1287(-)